MADPVVLLDGGMGKALEAAGAPFRQPEWSALALIEAPHFVVQVHQDFVDAGADVIITNNYAVAPFHLGDERFAAAGAELTADCGRMAREVADSADRPVRVAGSIPPMFGSYEPDRFDAERAPAMLEMVVDALAPFVDLFVAETQSSLAEARASALAASRHDLALWLSGSLEDGGGGDAMSSHTEHPRLRSGETVAELCELATEVGAEAVLFNCSQPEVMAAAVAQARAALAESIAVGAYANAFVPKPANYAANEVVLGHRADIDDGGYLRFVDGWIAAGASIVGGCCGVMPHHIADLRAALDS